MVMAMLMPMVMVMVMLLVRGAKDDHGDDDTGINADDHRDAGADGEVEMPCVRREQ
jgi:hypothetical protein